MNRDFSSKAISQAALANLKTPPQKLKVQQRVSRNHPQPLGPKSTSKMGNNRTGRSNKTKSKINQQSSNRLWDSQGSKHSFKYTNDSTSTENFPVRLRQKESKTVRTSTATTPYPEEQSEAKQSHHFMKIVNKFQNVFKKEHSETSQTRAVLKTSHSKPTLTSESNNFVWKKFEERMAGAKTRQPSSITNQEILKRKPVRMAYGQYTKNLESSSVAGDQSSSFLDRYVSIKQDEVKKTTNGKVKHL